MYNYMERMAQEAGLEISAVKLLKMCTLSKKKCMHSVRLELKR
jgi:hypothetical protein